MSDNRFSWIPAYKAIADAVIKLEDNPEKLNDLYVDITGADDRAAIDPFTFFTAFNRGMIAVDRRSMVRSIMRTLNVEAPVPTDFIGIPTANHELWQYFDNTEQAARDCWDLAKVAIELADNPNTETAGRFCELFDKVHLQKNVTKARLTRTLYWMRPEAFLPFGEKSREFLHSRFGIQTPVIMKGAQYLRLLDEVEAVADDPFYLLSARAYHAAGDKTWWPDLRDYDPDMSIHQWMVLLSDPEITPEEVRRVLERIHAAGDEATLDELADDRGHDRDYYGDMLRGYSRTAAREMGRSNYRGSWWTFVFFGKNAEEERKGDYIWKLRPEIADALDELDEQESQRD